MTNTSTLRIRVMVGETIAFGPGKASLLEAIAQTGSISSGARKMGMSYRRAWLLVEEMNRCFREVLVVTATGGAKGGGAQLTALARDILSHYRTMQQKAQAAAADDMAYLHSLILDSDA